MNNEATLKTVLGKRSTAVGVFICQSKHFSYWITFSFHVLQLNLCKDLLSVAKSGDDVEARRLIEEGADVNFRNEVCSKHLYFKLKITKL